MRGFRQGNRMNKSCEDAVLLLPEGGDEHSPGWNPGKAFGPEIPAPAGRGDAQIGWRYSAIGERTICSPLRGEFSFFCILPRVPLRYTLGYSRFLPPGGERRLACSEPKRNPFRQQQIFTRLPVRSRGTHSWISANSPTLTNAETYVTLCARKGAMR